MCEERRPRSLRGELLRRHALIWVGAATTSVASACGDLDGPLDPESSSAPRRFGSAEVVLPGHEVPREVTYEIIGGLAIFEGDIILGETDEEGYIIEPEGPAGEMPEEVGEDEIGVASIAFNTQSRRWPGGVVPYVIDGGVSSAGRRHIEEAIEHWREKTDLELIPRTAEGSYVAFVRGSDDGACFSEIGRAGGRQEIRLTSNGDCSRETLIHEIGHAVGLWHEHSRSDRDDYIEIHRENIDTGKDWNPFDGYESNFDKRGRRGADIGEYDYTSVMHYRCDAFSKNNQNTLTPRDPEVGCTQGGPERVWLRMHNGLSPGDIEGVQALYSHDTTSTWSYARCLHDEVCVTGDVDGDGQDDLVVFVRTGTPDVTYPGGFTTPDPETGDVYVALARSDGRGFGSPYKVKESFCATDDQVCRVADIDNDDRADLIAFHHGAYGGSGEVWVARSLGVTFASDRRVKRNWCATTDEVCDVADVDRDGRADLIAFHHGAFGGSAEVWVARSYGTWFASGRVWSDRFCQRADEICATGDFDGDGRADIVTFHHGAFGGSEVFVYTSDGYNSFDFTGSSWIGSFCTPHMTCAVADVDGDGRDDLVAFEGSRYVVQLPPPQISSLDLNSGDVWVAFSDGTKFEAPLLVHSDLCFEEQSCFTGDFNGDGKADFGWVQGRSLGRPYALSPESGRVLLANSSNMGCEVADQELCADHGATCERAYSVDSDRRDLCRWSVSSSNACRNTTDGLWTTASSNFADRWPTAVPYGDYAACITQVANLR